ncbi:hypothetical protein F0562_010809 [Nyssa sinensis]|uniref:E3 ubiquitin-protein ligase RMA n=1 Tax=Nyssa sinensis TaxID=561372 RepID=A0A5J5A1R7_9ASTE|nr:hypothetical protein F0562_010809 [Nyssa sinensis]
MISDLQCQCAKHPLVLTSRYWQLRNTLYKVRLNGHRADPVVTLCGHLYCWPCIYKWIHFQSASAEKLDQQQPQCPVCKAEVSEKTLVPLYGRGRTTKSSEGKAPHLGIVIPCRPNSPTCGVHTLITATTTTSSHPAQELHHRSYPQQSQSYYPHSGSLGGTTTTNEFHPMIGMFGEMVYARIFGNSQTTLYTYPNTYQLAGSSSPRMSSESFDGRHGRHDGGGYVQSGAEETSKKKRGHPTPPPFSLVFLQLYIDVSSYKAWGT